MRQATEGIQQSVLVTGAASGIGQATALAFGQAGALVWCADLRLEKVEETARHIATSGGTGHAIQLDVTAETDWEKAVEAIFQASGRLDVLVNSAGISHAAPIAEMPLEDWRRVLAINLDGTFLGTKHAVRAMRQAGGSGAIINISSASGLKAAPGASAYCASKAAVIMFSQAVAKECIAHGDRIRVNCICPAGVKTPMWESMPFFQELVTQSGSVAGAYAMLAKDALEGRFAEAAEIAQAALYLASDAAKYVTGTELVVDGGFTA
ncbi:MAG: SDR family oxidoreductase [Blastocatellia bacterium]|nr:SDR family oxidoreductase [Blastocatellia bacterium]